jgi:primosomal protein N' (replication factor Y) (superfamily II helicase)
MYFCIMFVDVILPLAIPHIYTYEVPQSLHGLVEVGKRVEVPIKNKLYSGIIYKIHREWNKSPKPRSINSIIDERPIIQPIHLQLWRWVSDYYCSTMGEVMQAALPASLKLESETQLSTGEIDYQDVDLSDDAYLVAEALTVREYLTIAEVQEILNKKSVYPVLRELMEVSVLKIKEELIEKYNPKVVKAVRWAEDFTDESKQIDALELVKRSEKQVQALLGMNEIGRSTQNITISWLCEFAQIDRSVVKALEKKGIVEVYDYTESRLTAYEKTVDDQSPLSVDQTKCFAEILQSHEKGIPVLLKGVTGSGKTRVYIEAIRKCIESGRQALYLLPEIALTTQILERIKSVFGKDMLVYHSKLSNAERVEVWQETLKGRSLILGARSALFLPFSDLGLIIVDEEHDSSFKQYDPAPRYHGRDVAVFMGKLFGCNILLGSATPSVESFFNANSGKYALTLLHNRYNDVMMPRIELIDTTKEKKANRLKDIFSLKMLKAIEDTILNKEQVIVFQNRRGYAPVMQCSDCGWAASCTNCDVKLTLHKYFNELRCHYCGYRAKVPEKCPECGGKEIYEVGLGTEKMEELLQYYFNSARIIRLDYDTTRTKLAYESILTDFANHKYDIMVGTQMVTKGFDFEKVTLVCIPSADALLYQPSYKATERAFQLMTQVAGRAGRRAKQGSVMIQVSRSENPVFNEVQTNNYSGFYDREIAERRDFAYPPFIKMIHIQLKHKDVVYLENAAKLFEKRLKVKLKEGVSSPITPSISRIKNMYLKDLIIKIRPDPQLVGKTKLFLLQERDNLFLVDKIKGLRINIDIDPI